MFVPLYIFVNIVFVLMSGMAYWILEKKTTLYLSINQWKRCCTCYHKRRVNSYLMYWNYAMANKFALDN